jgi:hypothetical protein
MPSPGDENFRPANGREPEKRPDDQHGQADQKALGPSKGSKLGELIPSEQESGEAAQTASDLFHQAAGLDKMPEAGKSHIAVKATEWQAQRSEGVSRAQNIAFANESGEVKLGMQYTNNDGTFFKTPQGATFRVEPNDKNGFDLHPIGGRGEMFAAVELRVIKDLFSASREDLSGLFKTKPTKLEAMSDPTIERPVSKESMPRPEPINFVPDSVSRNQRPDVLGRVFAELKDRAQASPGHLLDMELANLKELSRIIKDLCTAQPDLNALINIRNLIARSIGSSAAQRDFTAPSGELDFRPNGIVCTEYGISMSAVLMNVINEFLERRKSEQLLTAANSAVVTQTTSDVAKPQQLEPKPREIRSEIPVSKTPLVTEAPVPPSRPEKTTVEQPLTPSPEETPQKSPEETKVELSPDEQETPEATPEIDFGPDMVPLVESTVIPTITADDSEFVAQQLILQAQESSLAEDDEKAKLELESDEEADRLERELIKQQIKKRDEERRRRYVVKERDTLESIAVKHFKDVRLSKLIYEINKHLLPLKVIRGKQVRELKPRMVIFLPTNAEIEKFRLGAQPALDLAQVQDILSLQDGAPKIEATLPQVADQSVLATQIGDTASGALRSIEKHLSATSDTTGDVPYPPEAPIQDESLSATDASSDLTASHRETAQPVLKDMPSVQNPIDDDHVNYTVRLGDTLKSIAIRQPQLLDHSLWLLLAEVNGLTTEVDGTGSPTCKLTRGMRLKLPNKSEVESFKARKKNLPERP